jgi:hypothetical protein
VAQAVVPVAVLAAELVVARAAALAAVQVVAPVVVQVAAQEEVQAVALAAVQAVAPVAAPPPLWSPRRSWTP